jgi:hypothetical protein
MKLSELYHEKIALLAVHVAAADACDDADDRRYLNEHAYHSQREADLIAHCLAYFGDQDISDLLGDEVYKRALALPCRLENPWAWGIERLRGSYANSPTLIG